MALSYPSQPLVRVRLKRYVAPTSVVASVVAVVEAEVAGEVSMIVVATTTCVTITRTVADEEAIRMAVEAAVGTTTEGAMAARLEAIHHHRPTLPLHFPVVSLLYQVPISSLPHLRVGYLRLV